MTRNPYAHPTGPADDFLEPPPRVSALAVTGFVLSLLFCIPVFGLLGAILGAAALVSIAGSQGRKGGRGLAIAALILGVLGTFLWAALGFGFVRGVQQWKANVMTTVVRATEGLQTGDPAPLKRLLAAPASGLDDAALLEFQTKTRERFGAMQGLPKDVGWSALGEAMAEAEKAQVRPPGIGAGVPVVFEKGRGTLVLVFDSQDAFGRVIWGEKVDGKISNVAVIGPDGTILWLVDPATGIPVTPGK